MTVIHRLTAEDLRIDARPLTVAGFAPFGDVIENIVHDNDPGKAADDQPALPPNATIANQNSAIKLSNVSYMSDHYQSAPSQVPSRTSVSMFVCHPRQLRTGSPTDAAFDVRILERHPYTTQSFVPMAAQGQDYLVIVAPSLPPTSGDSKSAGPLPRSLGKPDLEHLHAFIAHGSQAVSYGAGVWHAPMIALGTKPMDFVVHQYVNGQPEEDCQEVEIAPLQPHNVGPHIIVSNSHVQTTTASSKL